MFSSALIAVSLLETVKIHEHVDLGAMSTAKGALLWLLPSPLRTTTYYASVLGLRR
jgi:hypothetical protein